MIPGRAGFNLILTVGLFVVPLAAGAQQAARVWRIGLMHVGLDHPPRSVDTFRETLKALGTRGEEPPAGFPQPGQ